MFQLIETRPSEGRRARIRTTLAALIGAAALCALLAGPARAASTHPYEKTFSIGPNCGASDIANDKNGNLYVACTETGLNGKRGSIRKYNGNGEPVAFSASVPYVSGNEINENPAAPNHNEDFGYTTYLDVDTSNSIRSGYIYVYDEFSTGGVDIFDPTGKYVTSLGTDFAKGNPTGVGIDGQGYIYISYSDTANGHISKFDPLNFQEIERLSIGKAESNGLGSQLTYGPCCGRVRADSEGNIWTEWGSAFFDGNEHFGKYEHDQFTTNINVKFGEFAAIVVGRQSPYLNEKFEIEKAPKFHCPEKFENGQFGNTECALEGKAFDVDPTNDDVYGITGTKITPYSPGRPGDPVHVDGPSFGPPYLSGFSFKGVAVDKNGNVYASQGQEVIKFSRGQTLPTVTTNEVPLADIGHTSADLSGIVDPAGGGEITACKVKVGKSPAAYSVTESSCDQPTPYPNGSPTDVTATVGGLTVGKVYHYRFEATNAAGNNFGGDRWFETKAVLNLQTQPATNIDRNSATVNGGFDPDGMETTYFYEYGTTTGYGLKTASQTANGPGGTIINTPADLVHLQSGKTYHFRLVGTNELGITRGPDLTFRTASPPEINGVGDENILDTSADVHATINPAGFDTSYEILYGPTPEYGSAITGSIPAGNEPVEVKAHLTELPSGKTIHYRVVATNQWGTSSSDDTTFDFRPPACPNAHVRALTGANYLPDCRAYELVTPGYAGAVQILPAEGLTAFGQTFGGLPFSPQNLGWASNPSHFTYLASLGSVKGLDAPNSLVDNYEATRTTTGWVDSLPGLKGNETKFAFSRTCSDSHDLCADYIGPTQARNEEGNQYEVPQSNAPFLYTSDGTRLGRLPTNVYTVKHGTEFRGDHQFSGDFGAFVFSTRTKFTPDGVTDSPGSVYYNDIGAKTVEVISYDANGDPIEAQPEIAAEPPEFNYLGEVIRVTGIAGVSTNGSRVLMAATTNENCDTRVYPFQCPYRLAAPARLYMRNVPAGITYEVSRGEEVNFVEMTRDGSKVFFITKAKLSPEDEDNSSDLYMWTEQGDQVKLLSRNGSLGNDDSCNATWVEKCGVEQLKPEYFSGSEYWDLVAHVKGIDDIIANESGDVYFFSPEDLVPGAVGGDNERNLYLFKDGTLRFVGTLDAGTTIERSQISPDGSHAAFLTKSNMTTYNSNGHREVYVYDATSGLLRCASCQPNGQPPTAAEEITVGESGPFMSNDGRAFFTTKESLVPQDTDGIRDVYEYVGGHPRLITSGTGDRDSTGGLEIVSAFFGSLRTGLESVSRDGTDVYFTSFESLAPEDKNGNFLKVYDARQGGGFDFVPELGPCVAADECHGAGSEAPAEPVVATGAGLGASGNLQQPTRSKNHRAKKRHHRRHHHRGRHHGTGGRHG